MYEIVLSPPAGQYLLKLDRSIARRIRDKLSDLREDPYRYTTPLVNAGNVRKLRVGDYRILLTIDNDKVIIMVFEIGHRKNIYK